MDVNYVLPSTADRSYLQFLSLGTKNLFLTVSSDLGADFLIDTTFLFFYI